MLAYFVALIICLRLEYIKQQYKILKSIVKNINFILLGSFNLKTSFILS